MDILVAVAKLDCNAGVSGNMGESENVLNFCKMDKQVKLYIAYMYVLGRMNNLVISNVV